MDILQVKNLIKHYPTFSLNEVSFSVPLGEIVGFIGRNGAGKSTTLKSILGLVHADGGEVFFDGVNVRENEKIFKNAIGVVLGDRDFYPKKKLKAITAVTARFYEQWDWEKYRHYCRAFDLDENKRLDELSTGMKVKYRIALALSHGAKLLIMDEPTSGLDPVSRDELVSLFREIVKDGTRSILFSTHITSDLEKCAHRIVFIQNGSIVADNTAQGFSEAFRDKGSTLEDIIVALERREWDAGVIV